MRALPQRSRQFIVRQYQRLGTRFRAQQDSAARPTTYVLASWAFLRLLGVVYIIAFASLWWQIDGLAGREGIVPIAPILEAARDRIGIERWWQVPTLCWWDASDGFLHLLCGAGVGVAVLVVLGLVPALSLLVLWVLYLSLATVCQPWLGFQWDNLLLETGFLSVWLAQGKRIWELSSLLLKCMKGFHTPRHTLSERRQAHGARPCRPHL